MSQRPEDRLIDHALRRVLKRREDPDLAPRIRALWERGVRGERVESELVETAVNGRSRRAPARRSTLRRWLAPAAALGAAALITVAISLRVANGGNSDPVVPPDGPTAVTVAHASRALVRVDDPSAPPRTALAVTDALWVPPGSPAVIELERGGRLALDAGSLLELKGDADAPELHLEHGALSGIGAIDARVRSHANTGFTASADASWAASVRFDVPAPTSAALVAPWRTRRARGAIGLFELSIESGNVVLLVDGVRRELAAGDRALIALDRGAHALEVARGQELIALCAELDAGDYEGFGEWNVTAGKGWTQMQDLALAVEKEPAYWLLAASDVRALLKKGGARPQLQTALLGWLAHDPSRVTLDLAREAWMEIADQFDQDTIVALAERGAFEFQREVDRFLDYYEPDAEKLDPLPIAAFHAVRGVDRGLPHLYDALAPNADPLRAGLAAAVLWRFGVRDAWEDWRATIVAGIELALEDGRDVEAAWMLHALEYLSSRRADAEPFSVAFIGYRIAEHYAANSAERLDETSLRAMLASLRQR